MTPRYRFSGHQTFPFRYPWLPKGIRALARDPGVFFRDDAIVTLGVGKNMVAAIRFWCEALKLALIDGRAHAGQPTTLGARLFGEGGWDPYLENPGTLWLLHWQLVDSPDIASTWYLTFTKWNRDVFSRSELFDWLLDVAEKTGDRRTSGNSLKRDLDVFFRTYIPSRPDGRRSLEDTFDCPLVELGLLRKLEGELYRFDRGPKASLPIEVFAYALVKFWNERAQAQETLSFERLLYGPGSPGAAFKLSESALATLLESLPTWSSLEYDETGGLRLLIRRDGGRLRDPLGFLEHYYTGMAREEAA